MMGDKAGTANGGFRSSSALSGVLTIALLMAMPGWAAAQTTPSSGPESGGLEEIVVTAEKRETRLQETPIAIATFSAADLEARSVRDVGEVLDAIPNVSRTSGPSGGEDGFYFIRGIGQVDSNPAGDPGVGTYIDEVYLARIQGASIDAADIGRVEVLRGPQGTLFGRNTIGGAVSIVTASPGDEFAFQGRITGGDRSRHDFYVAADLPISDRFKVRISALDRNQDGWGTNVYTGKTLGDIQRYAFRAKAVADLTDDIRLTVSGDLTRSTGTAPQSILLAFNPAAGGGTTPLGVPFTPALGVALNHDPFQNYQGNNPNRHDGQDGLSATLSWNLGDVTLKNIIAYRRDQQYNPNDFDVGPYAFYDGFFNTRQHQWSEELQVSGNAWNDRLQLLGGGYWFEEHVSHTNGICLGTNDNNRGPASTVTPFRSNCLLNDEFFQLKTTSYAFYGTANLKILDNLTLDVGARYSRDDKNQHYDFSIINQGVFTYALFGGAPFAFPGAHPTIVGTYGAGFSSFTPKFGLDYRITDDAFAYVSYSKGFKSGGFDGRPQSQSLITPYQPEKVETYEVGLKTDWLDKRLRVNLTGYHSDYSQIQLLVIDPASGFFRLTNSGDVEVQGGELEVSAVPVQNALLQLGVGLTDDHYTRLSPQALQSGIGKNAKLPVTPDATFALGGEYTIPFDRLGGAAANLGGSLKLRADYNYKSKVYYGAANGTYEKQNGYGLLNLRATYTTEDGRISISAFGLNVTNQFYYSNAQDVTQSLGVAFAQVGAPSEWGLEVAFKF